MTDLPVISLDPRDVERVAQVHIAAFPHSFLSKLGPAALSRYYAWQLCGPHFVVAQGVEIHGRLAGFCISGVFRAAMLGFLRRNLGLLARELVRRPGLVCTRLFAGRLVSGLYLFLRPRGEAVKSLDNPYRVLSLAVHPEFHGEGIGRTLLEAAERAARTSGVAKMSLRVDPFNEPAIHLYKSQGWSECLEGGCWQGLMVRALGDAGLR